MNGEGMEDLSADGRKECEVRFIGVGLMFRNG